METEQTSKLTHVYDNKKELCSCSQDLLPFYDQAQFSLTLLKVVLASDWNHLLLCNIEL